MLDAPVLFLINGNTKTSQLVFEAIRTVKPNKVYLASIVAGTNFKDETQNDLMITVSEQITWKCEVKTRLRKEEPDGHKILSESIDWFFNNEEMGIIVNSDYLPSQCFFIFAENMLSHYKNDHRIMYINGSNFQDTDSIGDGSYYYSKYNQMGAWATWKRTWLTIQPNLNNLNRAVSLKSLDSILTDKEFDYWLYKFQYDKSEVFKHYNYKMLLSQWLNNGLTITPNINLAKKIKIEKKSISNKHFTSSKSVLEILDVNHPTFVISSKKADDFLFKNFYKKLEKVSLKRLIKLNIRIILHPISNYLINIVKNHSIKRPIINQ